MPEWNGGNNFPPVWVYVLLIIISTILLGLGIIYDWDFSTR